MKNLPHNPGMSEKAWDDLHAFIAKMQIKHAKKLADIEKEVERNNDEEKPSVNKA